MTVEQNQTALTAQTITTTTGYNTFGAVTHQKDGRGNLTPPLMTPMLVSRT